MLHDIRCEEEFEDTKGATSIRKSTINKTYI